MRFVAGICLAALAAAGTAAGHPVSNWSGPVTVTKIKVGNDRAEVQRLANEGYDIAGVNRENGTVDVVTHGEQEALSLRFQGFNVVGTTSIDPNLAPDANYKTPDEVAAILRDFAQQYPGLARVESIGKSGEGRDIWAIKITDEPDRRELDEPTVLFNGMHHAREIMTPEVAIDTIEYLLTRYGTDADVTRWVDNTEIWIVPQVNPDGNAKVWGGSSMWRKNTRGGYGVDINRNYPYEWGACNGSSGSTFSDTYRGPSAGSEPETQALMGLVARIQPVFDISYHSYSELVIYPFGCTNRRTPTANVVESIGREMAGKLTRDSGRGTYSPGTSWELLYAVDGGDIDWMYHAHHVIPYVIEVNADAQGFQPAWRWRQPTVEKMRAAWSMVLDKLSQSGVRGVVTDGAGRAQPGANVTIQGLGAALNAPYTWRIKNDGTYHLVLNPGMYRLTFEINGRSVTKDVTIGADRVDMDVQL